MSSARLLAAAVLLAGVAAPAAAQAWDPSRGIIISGDIVTMNEQLEVIRDGRLVILGDRILALLRPGESLPAGADLSRAVVVNTGGWVFPGLIDAHNHVAYNVLPLYQVPQLYTNRYQWNQPASYKRNVTAPNRLLLEAKFYGVMVEVVKYAKVKSLVGGVTALQGFPGALPNAARYLVREIDNSNFGRDRVRQSVATVGKMDTKSIKAAMRAGQVDAWFIHLAEGTDAKSRAEFDALKADTLLNDMVVAIHCAGLTREQFRQMAAAGARVVWSPTSNLLLYGATADVPAALAEGCLVCLGADWSPSGCKNLLGELKMADQVDRRRFGDVISDTLLVKMVTSNPAFACGWDDCVGRLKPGYYADVAVFGRVNADPYRSLIDCTERDVRLVLVAGEPLYGDTALMGRLKPGDFEVLDAGGIAKGLDITRPGLAGADQSFADLRGVLQEAMEFDYEQMYEAFGNGRSDEEFRSFLSSELRQGYEPQRLDPLFPFGDTCFYNSLNRSANAAFGFDVRGLWEPAEQPVPDEWAAVLAFVNSARATARTLDFGVGLDPRAAANVVRLRDGADGRFGTGDDDRFETVAELDAVPYVGNTALAKLKAYVESLDADAKLLAFLNSAGTTAALLDDQVGLETRAARNIVAHRDGPDGQPGTADDDRFDDVAELLSVSYVGPTALSRLRQYAGDH